MQQKLFGHGHEGHPPNQSHSVGAFRHLRAPLCAKEYVMK